MPPIPELIFEHNKKNQDKAALIGDVRRAIRASPGKRAKESPVVDVTRQTDLDGPGDKAAPVPDACHAVPI